MQSFRPNLLKRDSNTCVFSCEICESFKNTFFTEHPRWLLLTINLIPWIRYPKDPVKIRSNSENQIWRHKLHPWNSFSDLSNVIMFLFLYLVFGPSFMFYGSEVNDLRQISSLNLKAVNYMRKKLHLKILDRGLW